ncbi:pentapeptide repeat-containing protein [Actinomadura violacea]|uniref:Pentapeptide repeat-containing protein n=1 Tax=Actinomadura violacea TaxID=2819934 RepID=A0ABS3S5T0_9ACTN|nr:pentapeptide repeat-containing protein [Actinomadura violacea]MBO2463928.1 pentapeptide repeat-containing protein [Actinomadura violacea]
MVDQEETPEYLPVKDAHKALGLWSIRRALTLAFSSAVLLLVASWFGLLWLLGSPSHAKPKPLDTTAQLELLKLVFALVAGIGALVALVTAYRRQRVDEAAGERAERVQAHAEKVARDAAHDATERRVTDLYGQAVEQLGHDKAAVRLGGLYSLERLAQDHPDHRQTVIDVVCAYLRMPFTIPAPSTAEQQAAGPGADVARQELQVRLTAQRVLKRHLTRPSDQDRRAAHWPDIQIDLTGALLIDFDFIEGHATQATFANAQFSGDAWFGGAQFSGDTWFSGAQFSGYAGFGDAKFSRDAGFEGAQFSGDAGFGGAEFSGYSGFDSAQFSGDAWFGDAQFSGDAQFGGTHFGGAHFGGDARFGGAKFSGDARFGGAKFSGDAMFSNAHFEHEPSFVDAAAGYPNDDQQWPAPWYAQPISADRAKLVRRG